MALAFNRHQYDIDLKEIFRLYQNGLNSIEITSYNTKEYHINLFRENIEHYCNSHGISYNDALGIIITPDNGEIYWFQLANNLLFYDIERINLFLNYHKTRFNGSHVDFMNKMEFQVLKILQDQSIFSNEARLNKVSKWIEKNKRSFIKTSVHLMWDAKHYTLLKALSSQLFALKYIKRDMDFRDVFLSQKIITWKESPESLIYLLNKFRNPPIKYISTTSGAKPFFQAAQSHFKFYDKEKNLIHRKDLRNVLFNVTIRSFKKYSEMRLHIDKIISELKDK